MGSGKTRIRLFGLGICGLALAACWEVRIQWTLPLREQEAREQPALAELRGRLDDAKKTIDEIKAQEQAARAVRIDLARLRDEVPGGSAAVWLPELVKGHFARFGIAVPLVRLNATRDEADISGCERDYFSVALPIDEAGRNIPKLLGAVADLHQQKAFVRVLDFAIRPDPVNPGQRMGSVNLSVLVRK
jgi:hypothetical protein